MEIDKIDELYGALVKYAQDVENLYTSGRLDAIREEVE